MRDMFHSLALTARDRMIEQWIRTQQSYYDHDVKRVYYLSAEYLMGRALINNLINLEMYDEARTAMKNMNLPSGVMDGHKGWEIGPTSSARLMGGSHVPSESL